MPASADRNLLFGIFALQNDFISRDQLVEAMNAWVLAKQRPLADLLRQRGALGQEEYDLLQVLVNRQLAKHGGDVEKSLQALSSVSSAKRVLGQVADDALQASLAQVGFHSDEATTGPALPAGDGARYRILRPHARGGLGEVFVAEDTELHRRVALKEIQLRHAGDPQSRGRFVLEAEITGGLEHPGIVPVYGLGSYADGRPFYAMRFIKGDSLKEAIARFHAPAHGPPSAAFESLEFRQLLRRFIDVCNAIAYAHARGVLHRDLKPGNIMLGKYGETLVVDWGLAKVAGRAELRKQPGADDEPTLQPASGSTVVETVAGSVLGTPAYMSPEQAGGEVAKFGRASDVYSLGATLYAMLTGQAPFLDREPVEVLVKVRKGEFPPPRHVQAAIPPALEAICLQAMAREPGDRYASALALAADVECWLADEPVRAYPEPVAIRLRRFARRHRTLVTSAAAVLLVATISSLAGLLLVEREREHTAAERDDKNKALVAETKAREDETKAREAEERARDKAMMALRSMTDDIIENQMARGTTLTEENKAFLRKIIEQFEGFAALTADDAASRSIRAEGYARVGLMRHRLGEFKDAEAAYADALALRKQLAADFPIRPEFRQDLAISHSNLGHLLQDTGRLKEVEAAYADALALRKQLAADFPTSRT